jgi:CheY-like chemotaxis protein
MAELKTRILVVDDDQRLRDLLVRYLGGEGYEVKAPGWTSSSAASATTWWCST